jgi:hypothetical protein
MKRLLFTFCTLLLALNISAQGCDENQLIIELTWAVQTDPNIDGNLARHHSFYNPDCTPKNVLLVHLVGTYDNPSSTISFPSLAANNGFHVVSLQYPNDTSAQVACSASADVDCHYKFRKEIIEGVDYSTEIHVDSVNSITNRLLRLLQYRHANNPTQGWDQYYTGNNLNWGSMMFSGHSQGGGHAAVIGIDHAVQRIIMFASPNDYSNTYTQVAPWTLLPHATADSAYYSFNNINDMVAEYNWQYTSANNFGEGAFGDSLRVDINTCPYNYVHNLYTTIDSTGLLADHGLVVSDTHTPIDGFGNPVFKDVWAYMLGIGCATNSIEEKSPSAFNVYPNPSHGSFTIDVSGIEALRIRILTTLGEEVYEAKCENQTVIIDTKNFTKGIYFVEVQSSDEMIQKKVVLQ